MSNLLTYDGELIKNLKNIPMVGTSEMNILLKLFAILWIRTRIHDQKWAILDI